MKNSTYTLKNLNDTNTLAQIIANVGKPNLVLLLNGPLGSGKTQITNLLCALLGVKMVINSPTFIIWSQYQTRYKGDLIHMDAYRLIKPILEEYYEIMMNNFMIIEGSEKLSIHFNNFAYIAINFKITDINSREMTVDTNLLTKKEEKCLIDSLNSL